MRSVAAGGPSKGEYEALMRCADKSTVSKWRKAGEVMDSVSISKLEHVQPAHAYDIARLAPREAWPSWVERCEQDARRAGGGA